MGWVRDYHFSLAEEEVCEEARGAEAELDEEDVGCEVQGEAKGAEVLHANQEAKEVADAEHQSRNQEPRGKDQQLLTGESIAFIRFILPAFSKRK